MYGITMYLDVIAGWDEKDSSTFQTPYHSCSKTVEKTSSNLLAGMKFGIPKVLKYWYSDCYHIHYVYYFRNI